MNLYSNVAAASSSTSSSSSSSSSPLEVLQLHCVSQQLQELGEGRRLLVVPEQLLLRHLRTGDSTIRLTTDNHNTLTPIMQTNNSYVTEQKTRI